MDNEDWERAGMVDNRQRMQNRRRNRAFRQRLQEHKHKDRQELALRAVSAVAALSWLAVGVQLTF